MDPPLSMRYGGKGDEPEREKRRRFMIYKKKFIDVKKWDKWWQINFCVSRYIV